MRNDSDGNDATSSLTRTSPGRPVVLAAVVFIEGLSKDSALGTQELEGRLIAEGGEVVQVLDPLLIGWFRSAATCIDFASSLVGTGVRAGISIGDVVIENGLLHGLPVIEASRIKDLAKPSQILCSARIADLVELPSAAVVDHGAAELKGISHPVSIIELR